jgi:hypothetical protein
MFEGMRVIALRSHMGVEEGDLGTVTAGDDYVPGLDAGRFTVQPDDFPKKSFYGHRAVSYWTSQELGESWAFLNRCWCGEEAKWLNQATDATPAHPCCQEHLKDGYQELPA